MKNKKQHYVPQFYLKNFSDQSQKAVGHFVVDRKKFIEHSPICNIACENFLYGQDLNRENFLARQEAKWAIAIRYIIEKQGIENGIYRLDLCLFIAAQICRTIKMRDEQNEMYRQIKEIDESFVPKNFDPFYFVSDIVPKITFFISDFEYLVIVNKTDSPFITSDNPVIMYNSMLAKNKIRCSYGIGTQGIQIFVPLSSCICVCLYDKTVYRSVTDNHRIAIEDAGTVFEINKLICNNSYNNLFFLPDIALKSYIDSLTDFLYPPQSAITTLNDGTNMYLRYKSACIHTEYNLAFLELKESPF